MQVMVRLQATNITNNTAQHPLVAAGGTKIAKSVFYADQPLDIFMPDLRPNTSTSNNITAAPTDEFLDMQDRFIVAVKFVRCSAFLVNLVCTWQVWFQHRGTLPPSIQGFCTSPPKFVHGVPMNCVTSNWLLPTCNTSVTV